MKKLIVLFLVVGTCFMTSCKKEEEPPPPPPPTKTELLSKTWQPHEVYENGQIDNDAFWTSLRIEFKSNKTYIFTTPFGAESGVWDFNSDQTKIILDSDETWDLINLTETQLRIKYQDEGDNYEIVWRPI